MTYTATMSDRTAEMMLETAAPASSAAAPVCANCGISRTGPWCHECGQHERMVHNSIWHLVAQAFEHLTNTDGKLLRSLRLLALHPARLTQDYLAGRRVSQLQPLSMFLTMLVVFLFVADREVDVQFGLPAGQAFSVPPSMQWIVPIGQVVHAHGSAFLGILRESAEWFGALTVPIAALLLCGIFAFSGRSLYAHLIFAMHSLTFQLLVVGIFLMLPDTVSDVFFWVLLAAMSAHLFRHMRGVYGGSRGGTVARMFLLGGGTCIAYFLLMLAWFGVAYLQLR
jgi:hypothetical protein